MIWDYNSSKTSSETLQPLLVNNECSSRLQLNLKKCFVIGIWFQWRSSASSITIVAKFTHVFQPKALSRGWSSSKVQLMFNELGPLSIHFSYTEHPNNTAEHTLSHITIVAKFTHVFQPKALSRGWSSSKVQLMFNELGPLSIHFSYTEHPNNTAEHTLSHLKA